MSKRDIETVCCLAAHLAVKDSGLAPLGPRTVQHKASQYAADAMRLQRLGKRARRNAAKRWIHPENRDTREEIQPYLDECSRIDRAVKEVLSPYGLTRVMVYRGGIVIEELPGNWPDPHQTGFGI